MADASDAPQPVPDETPAPVSDPTPPVVIETVPPPPPDPAPLVVPEALPPPPPVLPLPDPVVPVQPSIPPSPEVDNDIKEVLKNADHDDTSVTEEVNAAVAHETVKPTELDVEHPTLENEINEDTYHTTVQTITDTQTVPTQVIHTIAPVQERVVDERDQKAVEDRLAQDAAQFHDERVVQETVHTHASAPTVVADHHHYHVHERIQPVIRREIIQPTVVHTTVPVHEVHHRPAHFAPQTSLAPISMADFQQHGGHLKGRQSEQVSYAGKPRDSPPADFLYDNPQ